MTISHGDPVRVRLAWGEVVEVRYDKKAPFKKHHWVTDLKNQNLFLLVGEHGECRFVGPSASLRPMDEPCKQ